MSAFDEMCKLIRDADRDAMAVEARVGYGAHDGIAAIADLACGMESMRAEDGREPLALEIPSALYDELAARFTPVRRVEMRAPFGGEHVVTVAIGPPVVEDYSGAWWPDALPLWEIRGNPFCPRKAARRARMARKRRRGYP